MWISESKIREGSPFRLSETKLLTLDFGVFYDWTYFWCEQIFLYLNLQFISSFSSTEAEENPVDKSRRGDIEGRKFSAYDM